VVLKKS